MWVGGNIKVVDFIKEAINLGISRRLPFIPRQLNKGSIIYLASLQIQHVRGIDGKVKHETTPVIFGQFTVDHIEFIVDGIQSNINEQFTKKGLVFCQVTKIQERKNPKRMDGKRLTAGTIYAVDYPFDNFDIKVKKRNGDFTVYEPYLGASGLKFFRGIKEFDLYDYIKWINLKLSNTNTLSLLNKGEINNEL